MAAGLPILYHEDGGSIVDYCDKYGLGFDTYDTFLLKLETMCRYYKKYKGEVLGYENTINTAAKKYIEFIDGK